MRGDAESGLVLAGEQPLLEQGQEQPAIHMA